MATKIGSAALIPNPALTAFKFLIGEWQTTGTHPYVPDTILHGRTSFEWAEGGAFLIMRSEVNEPNFPSGIAVIGSDDAENKYFMLTFDERGVSRKYDLTITEKQLTWWRDDPNFSQRFTVSIEENGNKMVGNGEMRRGERDWEKDLSLTFVRLR